MKKQKRVAFIQDHGIFPSEMLVCVGLSKQEIIRQAKKLKCLKDYIVFLQDMSAAPGISPRAWFYYKGGKYCLVLLKYEDTWSFWELLLHELVHVADVVSEDGAFTDEMEARAYFVEHMFHHIRRKLQGLDPVK
jgi:hypothetical protein